MEVSMLAKAVYDRAEEKRASGAADRAGGGLAFAWNVAGDYLCNIKVMMQPSGRPPKAVSESRLCAVTSTHNRRRAKVQEAEGADGGTVEELSSCT